MQTRTSPKKVLITFARSFLALAISRHFADAGYEVFVADSINRHVSKYSKAVKKTFVLPSPRFESKLYIQKLIEIINREKINFLIPVYEETSYISKAIHLFPKDCKIFAPSFDLYHDLQNKWLFQKKLDLLGIETLKFKLIKNHEDLVNNGFNTPFALKPCYSRASQKIQKIDPNESKEINIPMDIHNPWIAQEWAAGKKYCSYSICHGGKIYGHAIYPVNYAIDGNSCLTFQAIEHDPIFEWIAKFVSKINYTGQIAFDFIESEDKKLFAIECNPRATSGLLLFNEKDRLSEAFLKVNHTYIKPKIGTKRQIAMGMLVYGWRKKAKPNNSLHQFIKDFFSIKDVIFKANDLKPFLFKPLVFISIWAKSRELGLKIPSYFTHDHDWNGEPF